jgi:hypothetical protein
MNNGGYTLTALMGVMVLIGFTAGFVVLCIFLISRCNLFSF